MCIPSFLDTSEVSRKELIARFEAKIQATLARVWGEEPAPEGATTEAPRRATA